VRNLKILTEEKIIDENFFKKILRNFQPKDLFNLSRKKNLKNNFFFFKFFHQISKHLTEDVFVLITLTLT